MIVFVPLIFIWATVAAHATVEIDNGVLGEPEVQCESDSISLLFKTKNPFVGKIFVKGYVAEEGCIVMGDNKNNHRFSIKHDSCGVRRQREVNGVVIISTIIVSFHSIFITKVDRAYRTSCFYVESTKKVQQQLDIASLTTEVVEGQTQLPVCRYEILSDGPNGTPIKYARIGDTVYHKWTCVSELTDVYCMRVHSCTVYDGQGGPPVTVLDANGCSIDGVILQNLDYISDLTAGKPAQVFKFADKAGLYFNCQIQLTIKDKEYGCVTSQPQCGQTYVEPSSKTTETSSASSSSEYDSHESGYPTMPADPYPTSKTDDPSDASSTTDSYASSSSNSSSRSSDETYDSDSSTSIPAGSYPQPSRIQVKPGSNRVGLVLSAGPSSDDSNSEVSSQKTSGAPGTKPTYSDLHLDEDKAAESTTAEPYRDVTDSYTRLIRRNLRSVVLGNRSQPVAVADFDLPERGLIVFGLEDNPESHGDSGGMEARRVVFEDRSDKTCFTTNKLYSLFVICIILFSSFLFALAMIVYRQRRMISQSFLKH